MYGTREFGVSKPPIHPKATYDVQIFVVTTLYDAHTMFLVYSKNFTPPLLLFSVRGCAWACEVDSWIGGIRMWTDLRGCRCKFHPKFVLTAVGAFPSPVFPWSWVHHWNLFRLTGLPAPRIYHRTELAGIWPWPRCPRSSVLLSHQTCLQVPN